MESISGILRVPLSHWHWWHSQNNSTHIDHTASLCNQSCVNRSQQSVNSYVISLLRKHWSVDRRISEAVTATASESSVWPNGFVDPPIQWRSNEPSSHSYTPHRPPPPLPLFLIPLILLFHFHFFIRLGSISITFPTLGNCIETPSGGDLAPSLGDGNFFEDQDLWMRYFGKKFHYFSHRPGFSDFPYLYFVKCRIWPFSSQENPLFQKRIPWQHFFLLCSYFRAHPTTLLLKILGATDAWAVPHLKFWGGPSLQSPQVSAPGDTCYYLLLMYLSKPIASVGLNNSNRTG